MLCCRGILELQFVAFLFDGDGSGVVDPDFDGFEFGIEVSKREASLVSCDGRRKDFFRLHDIPFVGESFVDEFDLGDGDGFEFRDSVVDIDRLQVGLQLVYFFGGDASESAGAGVGYDVGYLLEGLFLLRSKGVVR